MGDVRATAGDVLVTLRQSTPALEVFQGATLTAYNVPAESMEAQGALLNVVIRQASDIQIQQFNTMVLVRGRTADPRVRAWTFTLDSHDFYVLRLGDFETLVYDVKTEQWYNWAVFESNILPLTTGMNWLGGNELANFFGSNILCGDDSVGSIYLMSPEFDKDEAPIEGGITRRFERIVQGQVPIRGYNSVPCFGAQVYGDIGQADEALTVTLETSDDSGFTYNSQGIITIQPGDYKTRVDWRSLGSMTAPGRLFKITDDGAFSRIDGLEVEGYEEE